MPDFQACKFFDAPAVHYRSTSDGANCVVGMAGMPNSCRIEPDNTHNTDVVFQ